MIHSVQKDKKEVREKMKRITSLILLLCFMMFSLSANAYQLNGHRVVNPQYVTYWAPTNDGIATPTEIDAVVSAISSWQVHCPEIKIFRSNTINASMIIDFYLDVDNDAYAVTYFNSKEIAFYKPWRSLSMVRKQETAVHEAGHILGLEHCQPQYNSEAVMRKDGFNDLACPLADDKRGIAALY
ncbi:Matrixin [Clostridiales bacterium CHKCI001]|nr:Matrixin [Clostridiales bacterium CHKCI001]